MSDPPFREFEFETGGVVRTAKVPVASMAKWMRAMDAKKIPFRSVGAPTGGPGALTGPSGLPVIEGIEGATTLNPIEARSAELEKQKAAALAARKLREDKARNAPGLGESFARGAAQGASFNFADEAAGAGAMLASKLAALHGNEALRATGRGVDAPVDPRSDYDIERDRYRAEDASAEEAHKGAFVAGEVGGGLLASLPAGLAGGSATAARVAPTLTRLLKPAGGMVGRMAQSGAAAAAGATASAAGGADEYMDLPEALNEQAPMAAGAGMLLPPALAALSRVARAPLRAVGRRTWDRLKDPALSPGTADAVRAAERAGVEPAVRGGLKPSPVMEAEMAGAAAANAPSAIEHTAGKIATKATAALETMRSTMRQQAHADKQAYLATAEAKKLVSPEELGREIGDQKMVDELMPKLRLNKDTGERGFDADTIDALRRKFSDAGKEFSGKSEHGQARYFQRAASAVRDLRRRHYPGLDAIDTRTAQQADEFEATIGALGLRENAAEVTEGVGSQHWRKVFDRLVADDRLPADEALRKALASDPEALEMVTTLSGLKAFRNLKSGQGGNIGISLGATGPRPNVGLPGQAIALRAAGLKNIDPVGKPSSFSATAAPIVGGDRIARKIADLKAQREEESEARRNQELQMQRVAKLHAQRLARPKGQ